MKIISDILPVADSGLIPILILLDLTAPFGTISNPIILECLPGLEATGVAHQWCTSYS